MLRKIYKFFVLKSEKKLSFKLNDILEKLDFKNITLLMLAQQVILYLGGKE